VKITHRHLIRLISEELDHMLVKESSQRYTAGQGLSGKSVYTKDVVFNGVKYGPDKKFSDDIYFIEQGRSELGNIQTLGDPFTYESEGNRLRVVSGPETRKDSIARLIPVSQANNNDSSDSRETTDQEDSLDSENDYKDSSQSQLDFGDIPTFEKLRRAGKPAIDSISAFLDSRDDWLVTAPQEVPHGRSSTNVNTTYNMSRPSDDGSWEKRARSPGTDVTKALSATLTDDFKDLYTDQKSKLDSWHTLAHAAVAKFQRWVMKNTYIDMTNPDALPEAKDAAMKITGEVAYDLLVAIQAYVNEGHPRIDDDNELFNGVRWSASGPQRLLDQGTGIINLARLGAGMSDQEVIEKLPDYLYYALPS
jgi:disulfide oxidoreductase YuzD